MEPSRPETDRQQPHGHEQQEDHQTSQEASRPQPDIRRQGRPAHQRATDGGSGIDVGIVGASIAQVSAHHGAWPDPEMVDGHLHVPAHPAVDRGVEGTAAQVTAQPSVGQQPYRPDQRIATDLTPQHRVPGQDGHLPSHLAGYLEVDTGQPDRALHRALDRSRPGKTDHVPLDRARDVEAAGGQDHQVALDSPVDPDHRGRDVQVLPHHLILREDVDVPADGLEGLGGGGSRQEQCRHAQPEQPYGQPPRQALRKTGMNLHLLARYVLTLGCCRPSDQLGIFRTLLRTDPVQ